MFICIQPEQNNPPIPMPDQFDAHKFNDDLLLSEQDQSAARKAFPKCSYVPRFRGLARIFQKI